MQKFKLLESNEKYNSKCLEAGFSLPFSVIYAKQKGDLLTHFILINLLLPDLAQELVVLVRVARTGKSKGMIACSRVLACLLSGSPICRLQARPWRQRCLTGGVVPPGSQATLSDGRRGLPWLSNGSSLPTAWQMVPGELGLLGVSRWIY